MSTISKMRFMGDILGNHNISRYYTADGSFNQLSSFGCFAPNHTPDDDSMFISASIAFDDRVVFANTEEDIDFIILKDNEKRFLAITGRVYEH